MKKFILVIPLQPPGSLHQVQYISEESKLLDYKEKTRFPIITAMANAIKPQENVQIVVILTDAEHVPMNFQFFKDEVELLSKSKDFSYHIEEITTQYDERIDAQLKLFMDIISKIHDDSQLYACITYGTKPTPIILSMALQYGYKVLNNTSVECIIYGKYDHARNNSYIYDTTALFFMESIINQVAELKLKNPENVIRKMLELEGDEHV